MKILLSWSSGKDSAWALHVLRRDGIGDVGGLLTSFNEAAGRVAVALPSTSPSSMAR